MKLRTRSLSRPLGCMSCVVVAIVGAQPAHSQSASLAIQATGTIPSACSIAVANAFPSGLDFSTASSSNATATVNCSQGFKLNAASANGGVKTAATATGFASLLDYQLTVAQQLDNSPTVSASCNASAIKANSASCALAAAGTGLSSGGKTATNKTATLTVSWTPPASPRLLAGSYSDTITLSIAAAQ